MIKAKKRGGGVVSGIKRRKGGKGRGVERAEISIVGSLEGHKGKKKRRSSRKRRRGGNGWKWRKKQRK